MPERPEYIKSFKKPVNTEIKKIGENYYLYSRHSVYDPKTQKMRKKSGKILGKITPSGFIESNTRKAEKKDDVAWNQIVNVEFGASYYLYSRNRDVLDRLKEYFPSCWREIFAMAVARCLGENAFRRFDMDYCTSILPHYLGDDLNLDVVQNAKNGLIDRIGSMRESIASYMRADLEDSNKLILIDGHRILSASSSLPDAQLGYDSKGRHSTQVNVLYIFSLSEKEGMPAFYKEFAGSVPDCTALPMLLDETNLDAQKLTAVADKGFYSAGNCEAIEDLGIHYIVAVKRGCSAVEVPGSLSGYEGIFTFRDRSVYCKTFEDDGCYYHLFYDMELANAETVDVVQRSQRSNAEKENKAAAEEKRRRTWKKPKLTDIELQELKDSITQTIDDVNARKNIGTFILCTDRKDLSPSDVYEAYKRRQEIEQSFKGYDDALGCTASYMRSHEGMECWLFINHIALQMEYRMLNEISSLGLTRKYSFKDAVRHLSSIRANKIGPQWHVCSVAGKTRRFCDELGFKYPLSLNAEP